MLDTKLFRNVTIYRNLSQRPAVAELRQLDEYASEDPTGSQWRTQGFVPIDGTAYFMDVQGAGYLTVVQVNERNLPSAVVREKMQDMIASITEREGRAPHKKEYAMIKDEAISELLPKAFIKRKLVPVFFAKDYTYCFTSSAKTADNVIGLTMGAIGPDFKLAHLNACFDKGGREVLTTVAIDGSFADDALGQFFETGKNAVLKGEDKKAIRVKDVDVDSTDVQKLLKQGYTVTHLGLRMVDDNEDVGTFTINEHLVLTGIKLQGVTPVSKKADEGERHDAMLSSAWITAMVLSQVVTVLAAAMGGLRETDDDDEL